MRTHRFRADETCRNIEMRNARLYDHEAFWREERKSRRIAHPGSFTSSVAIVASRQRTLRGAWRKAKELVMVGEREFPPTDPDNNPFTGTARIVDFRTGSHHGAMKNELNAVGTLRWPVNGIGEVPCNRRSNMPTRPWLRDWLPALSLVESTSSVALDGRFL